MTSDRLSDVRNRSLWVAKNAHERMSAASGLSPLHEQPGFRSVAELFAVRFRNPADPNSPAYPCNIDFLGHDNWSRIKELVQTSAKTIKEPVSVLNLFAYTGGSTLAAVLGTGVLLTCKPAALGQARQAG